MSRLPIVVVVGRPNVGKSTLVNRIIGSRSAVVEELSGVTRDRREFDGDWSGREFVLVDTGGWEVKPSDHMGASIKEQAEAAVSGADVVIFVVDGTSELTDDDTGVISVLRSAQIPVVVAANKIDNETQESNIDRLWGLGLGEPSPISAYHGRGVGELLDQVVGALPEPADVEHRDEVPRVAIVGRPNVGKSTLLNKLVGERRVIVSETPGTTRDPIDVDVELDGTRYRLIDTAGIRRKPQITEDADFYAVLRAREALESADVALLLIDATEGVTHQDQRIASEVVRAGVGLVIILNKWDALDDEQRELTERSLPDRFGFVGWAPVLRMSARDRCPDPAPAGSHRGRVGRAGHTPPHRSPESGRAEVGSSPPAARSERPPSQDPLRGSGRYGSTNVRGVHLWRDARRRLPALSGEPAQGRG